MDSNRERFIKRAVRSRALKALAKRFPTEYDEEAAKIRADYEQRYDQFEADFENIVKAHFERTEKPE